MKILTCFAQLCFLASAIESFGVRANGAELSGMQQLSLIKKIDVLHPIEGLAVDSVGDRIYIADSTPNLHIYKSDGSFIKSIRIQSGFAVGGVQGIARKDGQRLLLLTTSHVIETDLDGALPSDGIIIQLGEWVEDPEGVEYDTSSGTVWVSGEADGMIFGFSSDGELRTQISVGPMRALGLARDERSQSFFGVDDSKNALFEISQDGILINETNLNETIQLNDPEALEFDPDKQLLYIGGETTLALVEWSAPPVVAPNWRAEGWKPFKDNVKVDVTIVDKTGRSQRAIAIYGTSIVDNLKAAAHLWTRYVNVRGERTLEGVVNLTREVRGATGRPLASVFLREQGGVRVFESGITYELRENSDPNGAEQFDFEINVNPDEIGKRIWLDPNPIARRDPVPKGMEDAVGIFAHEFGHALAFTGWKKSDPTDRSEFMSVYDSWVEYDGVNWWFTGDAVRSVWGSPLPLSRLNNSLRHYGNPENSDAPGKDVRLRAGLMNGVGSREVGYRFRPSLLDLAIASDCGVPLLGIFPFEEKLNAMLKMKADSKEVTITWQQIPMAGYVIWQATALGSEWIPVFRTNPREEIGGDLELGILRGGTAGFYRLELTWW